MKKQLLFICALFISTAALAQKAEIDKQVDSIEKSFTYQHGTITLKNNIGTITVPQGFKYLEPVQAEKVIVNIWGNPGGENITLGLILPENQGVLAENGYVFNIQYDEIGYVKDDDADEIDYTELLKEMKTDAEEENKERTKAGYPPVDFIGWANQPFYDKEKKILHWAKELKFGDQEVNTLNYNVRVLGRKGVLILNAISTMHDLALVKKDINKVLNIVQFSDGNKYSDFDSSIDEVAAWSIGGLVAGKVLAKVGFFALLLKFWKVIGIAVIGGFTTIWKRIRRRKEEENDTLEPTAIAEEEKEIEETQN